MKIVVASGNAHKVKEISAIMKDLSLETISMKDIGIDVEVEENGSTFEENAYIKAKAIYDILEKRNEIKDTLILADDSGLMVDKLNGAPGIYSARYAGIHGDDEANNDKLLNELKDVKDEERTARFVCSMVLLGETIDIRAEGYAEGIIIHERQGSEGFGYDPLFLSQDLNKTFAEATSEEKNKISHRFKALEKLKEKLKEKLMKRI